MRGDLNGLKREDSCAQNPQDPVHATQRVLDRMTKTGTKSKSAVALVPIKAYRQKAHPQSDVPTLAVLTFPAPGNRERARGQERFFRKGRPVVA